jgi:hypothetical protein
VPLDTDGDGVREFVVYRPSDQTWYSFTPSTAAWDAVALGAAGDVPVGRPLRLPDRVVPEAAGDFDHDGAADVTVFVPGTGAWWTLLSTRGYGEYTQVTLGLAGDQPMPGDFAGTGQQQRAVYRPSTEQWLLEDARTLTLGQAGDVPVVGDYDGDGKTDVAVYRPSTGAWFVWNYLHITGWGSATDVPINAKR